jgi:hypothetical protein
MRYFFARYEKDSNVEFTEGKKTQKIPQTLSKRIERKTS